MQNLPATNTYRNCFVSGQKDWVYVSSDFSSQELCITAEGSKDTVWDSALRSGKDLHSVCAEIIYGYTWKDGGELTCEYYFAHIDEKGVSQPDGSGRKCKCPKHIKLRKASKAINLGLCYGMSEFKLAEKLDISIEEAKKLIELYFRTFPSIKKFLDKLGRFGTSKGYSRTYAPYNRIRWYEGWAFKRRDQKFMGEVQRQSMNSPIQGTAADMIKESLVLIRRYILDNNVPVLIVMTVHDQIDTICHKDYAEDWKIQLTTLMENAANRVLPSGLLKAETTISVAWTK